MINKLLTDIYKLLRNDWSRNYRYHGGFRAVSRCLIGTLKLHWGLIDFGTNSESKVDCLTFSVVPNMTELWAILIAQAIRTRPWNLVIGDCSGGFRNYFDNTNSIKIIPILNYHHGIKLDAFIRKVCKADYVVISDDDVYWLNDIPWEWSFSQLEKNQNIAVISLTPRDPIPLVLQDRISSVLRNKVTQPMGSYCLIIRREIWLKENLSFRMVYPEHNNYGLFFDTADFANLELIRRGYKVVIAPPEIRANIVFFKRISSWILKIQKYSGDIFEIVANAPTRQEKALRTVAFSRYFEKTVREFFPWVPFPDIVSPNLLDKAESACESLLENEKRQKIYEEIMITFSKIRARLRNIKPRLNHLSYSIPI